MNNAARPRSPGWQGSAGLRKLTLILAALAVTFSCTSCEAKNQEPVSEWRLLLDTICTITLYEPRDRALAIEALDLCQEYEKLFSVTIEDSDVWRINHAEGAPVTVSPQTTELICMGLNFGILSGGMFDITIGGLTSLWNFKGDPAVPAAEDINAALSSVDFRSVIVSKNENTVQVKNSEARLDLGGIAKGFIADKIAGFLLDRGVKAAVIDLGGNVYVLGRKPGGSPWRVGVRKPFSVNGELFGTIETGAASVVTSGVYERQFESGGVVYHHILDPKTGAPVISDVVSATVITESSAEGDALSTTLVLAGSEKAGELTSGVPGFIGAILILVGGDVLRIGEIELIIDGSY